MDKDFTQRLASAAAGMANPKFDSKNPHFNSKFASLGSCMAAARAKLDAQGIALRQSAEQDDRGTWLVTYAYDGQDEKELSRVPLAFNADPQKQGSALTYARRYGLCAAFGFVGEEDDDGNAAQDGATEPPKPATAADKYLAAWRAYKDRTGKEKAEVNADVARAMGQSVDGDSSESLLRLATDWLNAQGGADGKG